MSPAQRRKKRVKQLARKNGRKKYGKFLSLLLIPILLFLLVQWQTRFWQSTSKTNLVIAGQNRERVTISIFDPELEKITNIHIPGSTQVDVARQLGSWQLGSVRELGENEGLGGQLLTETILKHFKLPVVAWADSAAQGYAEGDLAGIIRASFWPYKTNLGIGDRLKMGLFSLKTKNIKREEIDFSEGNYLKKTTLIGGEEGYVLAGRIPNFILALFTNSAISSKGATVIILDATGKIGTAEEMGEVVEVMGAKLANIKKDETADFDCQVKARKKEYLEEISKVFACKKSNAQPEGNFDIEIKIGSQFFKRF